MAEIRAPSGREFEAERPRWSAGDCGGPLKSNFVVASAIAVHRHGLKRVRVRLHLGEFAAEPAALRRIILVLLPSGSIRKGTLVLPHILILGAGSVNQASRRVKRYITSNSMVCASACL